jgi:hypothetical protein
MTFSISFSYRFSVCPLFTRQNLYNIMNITSWQHCFIKRTNNEILFHHMLFSGMICYLDDPNAYFDMLYLEWTTVYLQLYRVWNIPLQIPFVTSWIALRIGYTPMYCYRLLDKYKHDTTVSNVLVTTTTIIYGLFFYWTCKIIRTISKCDLRFHNGIFILIAHGITVWLMIDSNELVWENYQNVYIMTAASFISTSIIHM